MKSLVATVFGLLLSFAASALTLEPLPGTTAQVTTAGAFVPVPIGVVVRDSSGAGVAGVEVTFAVAPPDAGLGFFPGSGTSSITVVSDVFGIARPSPTLVTIDAGSLVVQATSPLATNVAEFQVTIESLERSLAVLSSDLGGITVQALDQFGSGVPFSEIEFSAPPDGASCTFNGGRTVVVTANEFGIAAAPPCVPNGVAGQGTIIAAVLGTEVFAAINFTNEKPRGNGNGNGKDRECKHDSKGGHKHDGKHGDKDC